MTTQLTPQERYCIYGVVLRHLSPIQKGIQFNHAVVGLVFNYGIDVAAAHEYTGERPVAFLFRSEHYSSVLLQCNSGNELHSITDKVADAGFPYSVFSEPDLDGLITVVAFQVPMEEKMKWDAILANNPDGIEVPEIWTVLNGLKLAY